MNRSVLLSTIVKALGVLACSTTALCTASTLQPFKTTAIPHPHSWHRRCALPPRPFFTTPEGAAPVPTCGESLPGPPGPAWWCCSQEHRSELSCTGPSSTRVPSRAHMGALLLRALRLPFRKRRGKQPDQLTSYLASPVIWALG